jgi:hypothetical protein
MKPPRLWPDALRQTRLQTWAPLLIPLLALALLADRWYPDHAEHRERHADTTLRLARAQALADVQPRYQEKAQAQTEPFKSTLTSALINDSAETSISQLKQHLHSLLTAVHVDDIPQLDIELGLQDGPATWLRVELRFLASPQQWAALETRLLPLKDRLTVNAIDVTVVPDPKRASQQLNIRMRLHAVHVDAAAVATEPTQ